jgi:hypothetical protein
MDVPQRRPTSFFLGEAKFPAKNRWWARFRSDDFSGLGLELQRLSVTLTQTWTPPQPLFRAHYDIVRVI